MSRLILLICMVILLGAANTEGQRHKVILHPPAPADDAGNKSDSVTTQKKYFDGIQAEREARELSDLAKSIQLDVEHVNHGLMPKDMIDKLKRIEKLSKHLRGEVAKQ